MSGLRRHAFTCPPAAMQVVTWTLLDMPAHLTHMFVNTHTHTCRLFSLSWYCISFPFDVALVFDIEVRRSLRNQALMSAVDEPSSTSGGEQGAVIGFCLVYLFPELVSLIRKMLHCGGI